MPFPDRLAAKPWEYGEMYLRHEEWTIGQRALCRRCGIAMPTKEGSARVALQCAGAATGRAAARTTGNINYIWARFLFSRRHLIEKGGTRVSAFPPPRWLVDLQRLGEVNPSRSTAGHRAESQEEFAAAQAAYASYHVPAWLRKPDWLPQHLAQPWEGGEDLREQVHGCKREELEARLGEHSLAFIGPIAYCVKCACFTQRRLGSRLKGLCVTPSGRAAFAVAYRLTRMRAGKHPITGQALLEDTYLQ